MPFGRTRRKRLGLNRLAISWSCFEEVRLVLAGDGVNILTQIETDQTVQPLSKRQLSALEALLTGSTVTDAAVAAGVARTSVHRWLKDDWVFKAELNRARREIRDAIRSQLLRAAESGVRVVSKAIEGGDLRVAMDVLKGLGLLGSRIQIEIGEDDPAALEEEARIAESETESERKLRSLVSKLF